MTDSLALERYAATQDPEAFAHLVQRYGQMVYATCLRTLGHATDAEDAAQDTFVQLATSAGSIQSNAAAWLHRTATNVSISRMRSAGRRRAREAAVATPERVGDATHAVEWAEIRDAVDAALAAMPDESRALIVQRYLVGRTQVDLADEHGVSASMMSRKVAGAVEGLRDRLRGRGAVAGVSALVLGLAAEAAVPVSADLMARLVTAGLAGVPLAAAAAATGGTKTGLWSLPIKLSTAVLGSMAIHGLLLGSWLFLAGSGGPVLEAAAPDSALDTSPATDPPPPATAGAPIRATSASQSVTLQYQIGSVAKQPDPCIVNPALSGVWQFLAEDVGGQPAPSAINASMWKMRFRFAGDTLEITSSDGSVRLLWRLTRKALGSYEEAWVQTLIEVEGDHDMAIGSEMLLFLTQWRVDGDRVKFSRRLFDRAADEWKPVPAGHFDANGHRVFLQRIATES